MNNMIYAVLLTLLAGFSTLIGALLIILNKNIKKENIIYILGFSIGIILCITFIELIPETYDSFKSSVAPFLILPLILISISIGIVITNIFDKLIHHQEHNLYHVGILTMLSVSLHKLPEAISLFLVAFTDIKLGLLIFLGVFIHHIPEGIMISSSIFYETKSKIKAFKYTLFSCLMNPLGIILAVLFSKYFTDNLILGFLFGISSGMLIFLLFRELIPTIIKYKQYQKTAVSFITGIVFVYILHLFIG